MYGLLCSIAVDWTVVMRQSSWALYWFCFLNLCLIKQIHVGWSFSTNVSIIARSAVSSVVTSQLLTVFNLLGQKKKFSYCQLERCWFIVFYLKKKKRGGGICQKIDKYCYFIFSGWACKALVFTLIPSSQKLIQSLLLETWIGWCGR